ncbi:uncharacterized protein [Miscanthus floridulus]|uniref:uncharacterized protein n=1 Tax=Miscanthus floridulus TaxID=154761 RepID=UPI0034590723
MVYACTHQHRPIVVNDCAVTPEASTSQAFSNQPNPAPASALRAASTAAAAPPLRSATWCPADECRGARRPAAAASRASVLRAAATTAAASPLRSATCCIAYATPSLVAVRPPALPGPPTLFGSVAQPPSEAPPVSDSRSSVTSALFEIAKPSLVAVTPAAP